MARKELARKNVLTYMWYLHSFSLSVCKNNLLFNILHSCYSIKINNPYVNNTSVWGLFMWWVGSCLKLILIRVNEETDDWDLGWCFDAGVLYQTEQVGLCLSMYRIPVISMERMWGNDPCIHSNHNWKNSTKPWCLWPKESTTAIYCR